MKEAISAIEALCKLIAGDEKATLNKALEKIENKQGIHPAWKEALLKLYAYTSDAEGIRHGTFKESNVTYFDAQFMLVVCTAFINYMRIKAEENGLKIDGQ